jgi:hypothetical protein
MRQWIDLMEAKTPKTPPVDHTARAQQVYDLTLKVAAVLTRAHYDFRNGWDQSWAKMIRDAVTTARKEHDDNEKSEIEYRKEQGESHTAVPFDLMAALPDVTARWWDQTVKDVAFQIEVDAKYEYEDYQDAHPRVEQSDELSALDDQLQMAKTIYYKGSDTIEGMTVILKAIESFVESLNRYVHFDSVTRSVQDFIMKAFPAFMTICLYMGARKA